MDYHELEKMTVVALREEAKKLGSKSTTGMKKDELIEFIAAEMGIEKPEPKPKKKKKAGGAALTKEQIKAKIAELRAAREAAKKTNDRKKASELRRRIHTLKRRQRKAA